MSGVDLGQGRLLRPQGETAGGEGHGLDGEQEDRRFQLCRESFLRERHIQSPRSRAGGPGSECCFSRVTNAPWVTNLANRTQFPRSRFMSLLSVRQCGPRNALAEAFPVRTHEPPRD